MNVNAVVNKLKSSFFSFCFCSSDFILNRRKGKESCVYTILISPPFFAVIAFCGEERMRLGNPCSSLPTWRLAKSR
jgi:hypothetical protein